jgi:hypothetical protein
LAAISFDQKMIRRRQSSNTIAQFALDFPRAGQDLGAPSAPGIDDTTAPIAAECQSFLDNVVAGFGQTG